MSSERSLVDITLAAKCRALIELGRDEKEVDLAGKGLKVAYSRHLAYSHQLIPMIVYHAGIGLQNKNVKDTEKDSRFDQIIKSFNTLAKDHPNLFVDLIFQAKDQKKYKEITQLLNPEDAQIVNVFYKQKIQSEAKSQKTKETKTQKVKEANSVFNAHYKDDPSIEAKESKKHVSFKDPLEEPPTTKMKR